MSSPSAARRKALRASDPVKIRVSPGLPIAFYAETANALHSAFCQAVAERNLDAAYVYGIRYATLVVEHMPQHPKYGKAQAKRNQGKVETVLKSLEQVTERMDAEELVKERQRKEEEDRKVKDAEERRRQREVTEQRQREARQDTIQKSALAKLKTLQQSARDVTARTRTPQSDTDLRQTKSCDAIAAEQRVTNPQSSAAATFTKPKTPAPNPNTRSVSAPTSDPTPLRAEEASVINTLNERIQSHIERLPRYQQQMVQLKRAALTAYHAGHRKQALHRVSQRRRVQHQYTITERAVFGMETQILLIQAAASDRDAAAALRQAEVTLQTLETGDAAVTADAVREDWDEVQEVNEALGEDWNPADEEDLLRELQEETDETTTTNATDESYLQLPSVPATETDEGTKKESSSWFGGKKKKKESSPKEPTIAASFM